MTLLMSAGLMAESSIPPIYVEKAEVVPERLVYVGIGVNSAETYLRSGDQDYLGYGDEFSNVGLTLNAGYKFQRWEDTNVAVEARIGQSVAMEDSENFSTTFASIFLRPTYQISKFLGAYGLIGGSYINWDGEFESVDATAFALGLGLLLNVREDVYVYADYVINFTDIYLPYFDDNVNFDIATVGIVYRF